MSDYTGLYRGSVHDINDPESRGRLRILVPVVLGAAPSAWAEPVLPTADEVVWRVGDKVWVLFEGGDLNRPVYISRMAVQGEDITPGAITPDRLGSGDGEPPSSSPTPDVKSLGYGGVRIQWAPAVDADDFTRYRLLFDSVNPPLQVLTTTAGTLAATSTLPDGTPLVPGTTYYAQVIATDPDGDGPPSGVGSGGPVVVPADAVAEDVIVANDLFSRAGYFGTVEAENIIGNELLAALAIVGGLVVGPAITITPDNGIYINGPDGPTHFPADGGTNVFSGDIIAKTLTVLGALSVRGTNNELATNSVTTAQSGTTPPMAAPVVTTAYPAKAVHDGFNPRGLQYFGTNGRYYSTENIGLDAVIQEQIKDGSGNLTFAFENWSLGSAGGRPEVSGAWGGITFASGYAFLLCTVEDDFNSSTFRYRWYVYKLQYNGVSGAGRWTFISRTLFEPGTNNELGSWSSYSPAIGNAASNTYIIAQSRKSNGVIRFYKYAASDPTTIIEEGSLRNEDGTTFVRYKRVVGITYGLFDFPDSKFLLVLEGDKNVYVFNSLTYEREPEYEFPLSTSTDNVGFSWDSSIGRFIHRTWDQFFTYSDITDTDISTNPLNLVSTWRKANAVAPSFALYETTMSPDNPSYTFPRRAWLSVSTGPIDNDPGNPNSPDAVSLYLARGAVPVRTDYHLLAAPAVGVNSATVDVLPAGTEPSPPLATDRPFPAATPALLRSANEDADGPIWELNGDGSGRMGPYSWDLSGNPPAPIPLTASIPGVTIVSQSIVIGWLAPNVVGITGHLDIDTGPVDPRVQTGMVIPVGMRPASNIILGYTAYGSTVDYRYFINTDGTIEFQMTGSSGPFEAVNGFWFVA